MRQVLPAVAAVAVCGALVRHVATGLAVDTRAEPVFGCVLACGTAHTVVASTSDGARRTRCILVLRRRASMALAGSAPGAAVSSRRAYDTYGVEVLRRSITGVCKRFASTCGAAVAGPRMRLSRVVILGEHITFSANAASIFPVVGGALIEAAFLLKRVDLASIGACRAGAPIVGLHVTGWAFFALGGAVLVAVPAAGTWLARSTLIPAGPKFRMPWIRVSEPHRGRVVARTAFFTLVCDLVDTL